MIEIYLIVYFVLVNLAGFSIMGLDKWKAKKKKWRIREAYLFLTAIIGGSIGAIIGMYCFKHKTRHKGFVYGMPIILLIQIALVCIIWCC